MSFNIPTMPDRATEFESRIAAFEATAALLNKAAHELPNILESAEQLAQDTPGEDPGEVKRIEDFLMQLCELLAIQISNEVAGHNANLPFYIQETPKELQGRVMQLLLNLDDSLTLINETFGMTRTELLVPDQTVAASMDQAQVLRLYPFGHWIKEIQSVLDDVCPMIKTMGATLDAMQQATEETLH